MGHAITINSTLQSHLIKNHGGPQKEYSCSGTPADCVKLGINELMDRKPIFVFQKKSWIKFVN